MPPKRGHPRKRVVPDTVADVGSALRESQHTSAQTEWDLEMERMRQEVQKLREEVARGKSQTSSATSPMPATPLPRRAVRKGLDEEGRSL